jgi:citrate synthase
MVAQRDTLSIVDNRTGKSYELAITDGAINATDLSKIKSEKGEVTRSFDPAYMNTVNCISKISFIDGDKGILEYRGYPIE